MRVDNPFLLTFANLSPSRAKALKAHEMEAFGQANYASIFREGFEGDTRVRVDGELLRTEVSLRYGLGKGIELFGSLRSIYGSGGFLDRLIENYHDLLGLPQAGRDSNPDNQFVMEMGTLDGLAYELEDDELGLLDTPLGIGVELLDEVPGQSPALMAKAVLELPTGSERRGRGNGHVDLAAALAAEMEVSPFILYGLLGASRSGEPDDYSSVDFRVEPVMLASLALEWPFHPDISGLAQIDYRPSPVDGVDILDAEQDALLLTFGFWFDLTEVSRLQIAFVEDLYGKVAQDFTASLGLSLRW